MPWTSRFLKPCERPPGGPEALTGLFGGDSLDATGFLSSACGVALAESGAWGMCSCQGSCGAREGQQCQVCICHLRGL